MVVMSVCFLGESGRTGGSRTHNQRFWRPLLCQLSYRPVRVVKETNAGALFRGPRHRSRSFVVRKSLDDFEDLAGADGLATFAESEALALFHRDGLLELDRDRDVVARHHHFHAFREDHGAGGIASSEEELRAVVVSKRGVAAAFILLEDVNLGLGDGVGLDAADLGENLTAFDLALFNATEEETNVISGLALIEFFTEHFNTGTGGLDGITETDDFDFFADLDDTAFDTTGSDSAAAGDGEDVFNGHHEGLVDFALRLRNFRIQGSEEVLDGLFALRGAFESRSGGATDDLGGVAFVVVLVEEVADFHLDEVNQVRLGKVDLIEPDDDLRHADLAGEEDVLLGLGHDAVSGGDHEDGTIHLGGAGDHVLNEVGVARAVDVSVVTVDGLVLDVRGGDGHGLGGVAHGTTLGDFRVGLVLSQATTGLDRHDGSGGGRFTMVNVTDGTDIDVRLGAIELLFGHGFWW